MKKLIIGILLIIGIVTFTAAPVFAAAYTYIVTMTETGGNTYSHYPFILASNNSGLISNGYLSSDGLDAKVIDGSSLPCMLTTTQTLFVDSIMANHSANIQYTTGNTPASSMPIIVGNGGYITTSDAAALEPGSNFSIVVNGYIDTTAGSNKNIVSKSGALVVEVDSVTSGFINATLDNTFSQTSYNTSVLLYSGNITRCGERFTSFQSAAVINAIGLYLMKVNSPTGTASLTIRKVSDDSLIGTLGTIDVSTLATSDTLYVFDSSPVSIGAVTDIRISLEYSGGDSNNYVNVRFQNTNPYSSGVESAYNGSWTDTSGTDLAWNALTINPLNTGVGGLTSGIHTVTVSLSGGTFTLLVDSNPPATASFTNNVPDTANDWVLNQNNVMPYINYYKETVNGTEIVKYQPQTIITGTTLPDLDYDLGSGTGKQDGTITFGSNPSGITISSGSFSPSLPSVYNPNSYGSVTPNTIISGSVIAPPQLYTELDTSKIPFGAAIDAILTAGGTPAALWWFPFIYLGIVIIGLLVYDLTQRSGGQGSLLAMCATILILLVIFGVLGVTGVSGMIPLWSAILFLIPAAALILSRRHVGWG